MSAIEQDRTPHALAPRRSAGIDRWALPLIRHEEILLFVLFLIVCGFFALAVPAARQPGTYLDLLRDVSPNLIAAIGVTLLLLAGQFDLSVGSMLAFTGVATVSTFNATGNMWLGILAGLLTGPLVGAINGYLVTVQGMSSLMTTLGMLFALRGLVYVWTNTTPVVDENRFTAFTAFYQGSVLGVPLPGLLAVVLIAIGAVLQATSVVSPSNLIDSMENAEWDGLLPYLTLANLYLVGFNILPAFPMDGGRVLRALLALRMDYVRATGIAVSVGQALAFLFGLAGFATGNFFLILIAIFIWFGASAEGQQVAVRGVLGEATVGQVMTRQPQKLYPTDPLTRAVGLTLSTSQADFPVVDGNERVVGLLTMDDLLRGLQETPGSPVGMVMHRNFPTASPEETIVAVQARLAESRVRAIPIVAADGSLAGFLTAGDIGEAFRLLSVRPQLIGRGAVNR